MASIFDSIFARDQSQTTNRKSDSTVKKSATAQETALGSTQTGGVQAGKASFLDQEVQDQIAELISGIGGGADIGELFGLRQERALSSEADIAGSIEGIVNQARSEGEQQIGRDLVGFQNAAGSSLNTLVRSLETEGRTDLETSLGGLQGQLELQGRQLTTDELSGLTGDISAGVGDLGGILKGATAETRQENLDVTQSQSSLVKILEELTKGKTTETGGTKGTVGGNAGDALSLLATFLS